MPELKVYGWERETWPEFRVIRLSDTSAEQLVRKCATFFKVPVPKLTGGARRGGGSYQPGKRLVCLDLAEVLLVTPPWDDSGEVVEHNGGLLYTNPGTIKVDFKDLTLATLCHELAHHLNHHVYPEQAKRRAHGKGFRKCLRRMYGWARRYLPGKEEVTLSLPHWYREREAIEKETSVLDPRRSERAVARQLLNLHKRWCELFETTTAFNDALDRGVLRSRPLHKATTVSGKEASRYDAPSR